MLLEFPPQPGKVWLFWLTFSTEKVVREISWLIQINGNHTDFHGFPHVPGKALARKEVLEKIHQADGLELFSIPTRC